MSKSCPVGKEWDEFVAGLIAINNNLTTTDALTAYNIHNSIHNLTDVIPSVDDALKILIDLSTLERDEEMIRQNNSVKVGKFQEQVTILSSVYENFANAKQKNAVGKLIDMSEKHIFNLQSEDVSPTISVSRFIGSSTFKGDPAEYQAFKLFGTFVHDVLEYTQKGALEQGNISPKTVFNREFFDARLKEYRETNPFEIKSLTDDKLYLMTQDLVLQISALKSQGYLVLPEISVIGNDAHGTKIVGRIDMLLVDPTGKVKVYDFKTKKIKLFEVEGDWTQDEASAACTWLAFKEYHYNTKDQKEGTQLDFLTGALAKRSPYDTWALQVNIYKNILEQNDIDVSGHAILALLYETDEDKNFLGSIMHQFELENYYAYADFETVYDIDGVSKVEKRDLPSKIDNIVRLVNKHVPTKRAAEEIVIKPTKLINEYIQPTEEEYAEMRNNIKNLVDKERIIVNNAIKKAKTIATRKLLEEKRDSLTNYAMLAEKMSNEDFDKSINTATALDYLNNEFSYLHDRAKELHEKFEKDPKKFNNNDLKKMSIISKTSEGLSDIINVMKRVLNEAKDTEGNRLTEASPAQNLLGVIEGNKEAINFMRSQIYRQMAVTAILKSPGEKAFKRINSQIKEIAEKEIELLEQEIEELKSGKGLTMAQRIRSKALETVSKSYKDKLGEKLDQNAPKLTLITEKENKVNLFKKLIAGTFDFNDASVLAYIDNITNPDSNFYVGSDRLLPYDAILSNSLTNEWVASVANKDLALSGVTKYLKDAAADAVKNAQNHFATSNFDKLRDQLYKSGKSFEDINSQITEKVIIKYRNPNNTDELLEKEILAIVAPYTQEFKDTFNSYKAFLKESDFNIRQYKSERNNIFTKTDDVSKTRVEELTKLILDAQNDRSAKVKTYNTWMINNCSKPFKDEFYEVQKELPTDIAEQLQDKYLELETYRYNQDKKTKNAAEEDIEEDNDDQTIDLDFERIGEIEDEIKGLREEAKERDPKYAEYIDRLNEFYEFDIRYDYYNRQKNLAITKYANNPELMQKWLDENEITTPSKEWYDELSDLYDQLAIYFGADPAYQDLTEKRAKILRKHKYVDGVLRPQYMSDTDIENYDAVEAQIAAYKDSRIYTELDEADVEAVDDIFYKINSLKQKDKNKYYVKDFDMRLNKLKNRWAQVTAQEAVVAGLTTKGATPKDITSANKIMSKYQSQFFKEEKEFKAWYEKHHTNKYKSITKGNRVESYAAPKEYNYTTVPADAVKSKYLQTSPHPKFTKRRMKQDAYYIDDKKLNDIQKEELLADPEAMATYEAEGRLRFEEGVYNKDYLESPDGLPMPKNIMKIADNVYAPKPGAGFDNINPRYLEMYNDKQLFEFYAALTSMFFELQKQTDGRPLGYIVPGAVADFVQNVHASGISAAITKKKDIYIDKNLKAYGSAQDINDAIYGDVADNVRLRGNTQFDALLQSTDAVSSVMQWVAEAHYNVAMQEAAPIADAFIDELKSKSGELHRKIEAGDKGVVRDVTGKVLSSIDFEKRAKELDGIIALAVYERNKFINGQYEDKDVNRRVQKTLKTFFSYTSMIRIGFDVTNQAKNYVAGSIQGLIASCNYETGNYGTKDFLWAKAHILGFNGTLAKYARDLGNISDVSPETMIYRLFNPVQKEFSKYVKDTSGSMSRKALGKIVNLNELAYFLQDKGDSLIGMTVMWSVLHGNKYRVIEKYDGDGQPIYAKDANGDDITISAHDCYIKDENTNELKIRNDVEYNVEDEKFLRNIIYSEMRRAQGNYAKADQVQKEATPLGKIVLFFRKYLVPLVMNRFGYAKTNWEAGEVAIGYWRAVAMAYRQFGGVQVAKHLIVGGKTMNNLNANTMGTFLTAKVGHARRDALTMAVLTLLSMAALMWYKSRKDDDDDEDKSAAKTVEDMMLGNMFRLVWQVKGETLSMVPFAEGSAQYIQNFTTGIPFVREFTAGAKFASHAVSTTSVALMGGSGGAESAPDADIDSQFYQEAWKNAYYSRRAGSFEKGDAKIMKDFIDLTGIRNFRDLLNPENRLQYLQSRQ